MTKPDAAPATMPGHDEILGVWEGHPDEAYRRDQSHWRGEGRWATEKWAAIGLATREQITRTAAMLGREVPRGPLLEWGPGGGTNLHAFADHSSRLYGVDLSTSNLGECARMLGELDTAPPFTQLLVGADPGGIADDVDEPIDLFVSTAVFQHFPGKAYGETVLRTVKSILSPQGIGCVQIRYDDGTPRFKPKSGDYAAKHITFTSWPIDEFWDVLVAAGLRPIAITDVTSRTNYATFTFVPA